VEAKSQHQAKTAADLRYNLTMAQARIDEKAALFNNFQANI